MQAYKEMQNFLKFEKMYKIKFYEGDYRQRQKQANKDGCDGYVEHHFNASTRKKADYTVVITGYYAGSKTKKWARTYARYIAKTFNTKLGGDTGLQVGGYDGRGTGSLRHTYMPAILLEPLFCSNPKQAAIIKSGKGQDKLAQCLVRSIKTIFPPPRHKGIIKIGFSVGHKYKKSRPKDRGATVYGGGMEADYTEIVLKKAKVLLENTEVQQYTQKEKIKKQIYLINIFIKKWRVIKDGF